MTSFQGASDNSTHHALVHDEHPKPHSMKPRSVLTLLGSTILLFVLLIPMLDANRLIENPTFVFFVGRGLPQRLMWICLLTIVLYIFLIFLFFAFSREEAKTDQSLFLVFGVVITTLGLSLLMISIPLKRESMSAYQEIFTNCQFGPRTQRLYEYSTVLQGIRATPACSLKGSVTMCDGYQESMPYTGFLSSMEHQYKCAGFCYGSSTSAAAAVAVAAEPEVTNTYTTTPPASELLETPALYSVGAMVPPAQTIPSAAAILPQSSQMMMSPSQITELAGTTQYESQSLQEALQQLAQQKMEQGDVREAARLLMESRRLNADLKVAFLQTPSSKGGASKDAAHGAEALPENLAPENFAGFSARIGQAPGPAPAVITETTTGVPNVTRATPGMQGTFPPTLFSDSNYQSTCDGMAARDLKYQAMHVAQMIYCEGVFLLLTVLLGGLLRICGFCIQLPAPRWKKPVLNH